MKGKGGTQIRTGGRGFADLGLTTWLCRQKQYQQPDRPLSGMYPKSSKPRLSTNGHIAYQFRALLSALITCQHIEDRHRLLFALAQ